MAFRCSKPALLPTTTHDFLAQFLPLNSLGTPWFFELFVRSLPCVLQRNTQTKNFFAVRFPSVEHIAAQRHASKAQHRAVQPRRHPLAKPWRLRAAGTFDDKQPLLAVACAGVAI